MADKDLRILERNAKLNPNDQESSSKFIYSKFRTELGTIENIISKLIEKIKTDPEFSIAWEIATHNCQGPIRLVGGRIYRGLVAKKFEINNLNSLELAAKRYGCSNQAYIDLKTKTLENVGFRWQPQ